MSVRTFKAKCSKRMRNVTFFTQNVAPFSLKRNSTVNGVCFAKFRTGKFRPGIAFTICTNQFHLPKKECKGLKLVSKMALEKWNLYPNFFLDHSVRKKKKTGLSFQMSRCFDGMTQKVEFHLLPNRIFRKLFVKGKQLWFTRDSSINYLR